MGTREDLTFRKPCTYRFQSKFTETKGWIVSDSKLEHNHPMGLYEMKGSKTQLTEKRRKELKALGKSNFRNSNSRNSQSRARTRRREDSEESEEAQEIDSDQELDDLPVPELPSRLRNRSKRVETAKITETESPQSHPTSSTSQRFITPSATSTSAFTPPVITPIPNLRTNLHQNGFNL